MDLGIWGSPGTKALKDAREETEACSRAHLLLPFSEIGPLFHSALVSLSEECSYKPGSGLLQWHCFQAP